MDVPGGGRRRLRRIAVRLVGALVLVFFVVSIVAYFRSTNECADRDPVTRGAAMRAVIHCDYGSPEVLRLETVKKPMPGDSQVLVRVHAAAANPLDWHSLRGEPYVGRLGMGLRKPRVIRLGVDFAGTVEAVGRAVTAFRPGDEVFGARTGAFAEYVVVREGLVVAKPSNVTFEEAAAVPVAALTALQALRDHGKVERGQKVLINGASGGVGTFAVQLAKVMGAEVTAVASTRNLELVRSIGADHVVDYTNQDFTKSSQQYDVIVDNVGNHSLSDLTRVLAPGGRYVMVGGRSGRWLAPLPRVAALVVRSKFTGKDLRFFISQLNQADLTTLRDLLAAGQIVPVIDRRYALSEVANAIEYLETGRARGKVIVVIE